jgi:hypothetical protein
MKNPTARTWLAVLLLLAFICASPSAYAQLTPLGDAYTNSADPTTNYGAKTLLDVDGATQITYIQFNLSSIPTGASVSQATLKLYVNTVTTAGSFEVYAVNGAWSESTITYDLAPALGSVIDSGVALTTADKNQYILIPMTSTVQGWVTTPSSNNGIALVAIGKFNATFDSKENTTTSHPAELDVVFAGDGTITGVDTASASGLTGGGTSGTLNLSLTNACAANQVLQWNGASWICAAVGTGTITGVTAGTGLTGGGMSGSVTLSIASNACASGSALSALPFTCLPFATLGANAFANNQLINGAGGVGNFGLTVNQPTQTAILVEGPIAGAGAGLDLQTTGTGGKDWEILATGKGASQGVGKLNIRDISTSVDVLTLDALDNVNVDTNLNVVENLVSGGTVTAGGAVTASTFNIGANIFAFGSSATGNAFLGFAGNSTMTGDLNAATGTGALASDTTGCCNTATGSYALENNTGGGYNTAVGWYALSTTQDGEGLTCVGYDCSAGADGLKNATAIGAHAVVGASNSLVLGGTGRYAVKVGIGTEAPSNVLTIARGSGHPLSDGWDTFSSRRWKTNIQTLHGALAKVEQLRGVSYDLKAARKHEVGLIAEEVGAVVPEVVSYEENGKDARGVDYSRLTALLIEATKEQQREIKHQQVVLRTQQAALRDLRSELRATRQTLQKVKAQVAAFQLTVVAAK